MNILLLSMPDSFEHMPPIAVRVSNDVPAADGVQNRTAHTIASVTSGISLCVSSEAIEANPRTPMSQQFRDDGLSSTKTWRIMTARRRSYAANTCRHSRSSFFAGEPSGG